MAKRDGETDTNVVKEGTRSVTFGRRSLDERRGEEKLSRKLKGRLRALTGGRESSVEHYRCT